MRSLALDANGADPGSGPVFGFLLDRDASPDATCLHSGLSLCPCLGKFPGDMETAVRKGLADSLFHCMADHLSGMLLDMDGFVLSVFETVWSLTLFRCKNPASAFAIDAAGEYITSDVRMEIPCLCSNRSELSLAESGGMKSGRSAI